MESIALIIGYIVLGLVALAILTALYQWALYGEIGNSMSSNIVGGDVYINGTLVAELKGGGNISVINGSVYQNGKLIYKHTKKFRWEKANR